MSELKSFESARIYWAVEQVERVAGDIDELHLDENEFYIKSKVDDVIAKLKSEKEELLIKFRKFIDDHCLTLVTATRAVENLSPNIQMDFYEEFIKENK